MSLSTIKFIWISTKLIENFQNENEKKKIKWNQSIDNCDIEISINFDESAK